MTCAIFKRELNQAEISNHSTYADTASYLDLMNNTFHNQEIIFLN